MDWDSWNEIDKTKLKASKNWFNWWCYGLSVIPLLVGSFVGAIAGEFHFFTLILLALVVFFGKTAFASLSLIRENQGLPISICPYIFESAKLPFSEETVRFIGYLSAILTLVFGLILCLVSSFGLLTFGILGLFVSLMFFLGYARCRPGLAMALSFLGEGIVLTAAAYYAEVGTFAAPALVVSLPIGFFLAALVLWGEKDKQGLFQDVAATTTEKINQNKTEKLFMSLIFAAYAFVILNVLYGVGGFWSLLLLLLIPFLKQSLTTQKKFMLFYVKFGLLYSFCMLLRFTF